MSDWWRPRHWSWPTWQYPQYLYPNLGWYPPPERGYSAAQAPLAPTVPRSFGPRMEGKDRKKSSSSSEMSTDQEKNEKNAMSDIEEASTKKDKEKKKEEEKNESPKEQGDQEQAEKSAKQKKDKEASGSQRQRRRRNPKSKEENSGQQRPPSPKEPPKSKRGNSPEDEIQFSEDGQVQCLVCKKWVNSSGFYQHTKTNLICLEKQSARRDKGLVICPKPNVVWHECHICKEWKQGAYGLKMHLEHKHHVYQADREREIRLRPAPSRPEERSFRQRSRTPSSRGGRSHWSHARSFDRKSSPARSSQPAGSMAPEASSSQVVKSGEDRAEALADLFEATSRVLRSHKK